MNKEEEWEDIEIWDANAILNCAIELVHDAKLAKQAEDFKNCSLFVTKALDMINDVEIEFPKETDILRSFIEEM